MNESNPIVPPAAEPLPQDYRDRSGGLVVFGVLTIVLGVLSGLMLLMMLMGPLINALNPNAPATSGTMLAPVILVYGGQAVVLIWLGIGSIKARRWARALLLIVAWSWLIMGVVTMAFMAVFIPKMLSNMSAGRQEIPHGALIPIVMIMGVTLGFMFILIPGVWAFFYGSRHVKATCEARDPVPRWTDVCPLPVLALSLWVAVAVPFILLMPVMNRAVLPFFGTFLHGVAGSLIYLVMAAVWAWAAWRLYRLDSRAWWVLLVALVLFCISSVVTYSQHDPLEMYQLMGYPEAQIEQLQNSGLMEGNRMGWLMSCSILPFLAYMLFVKGYLCSKQRAL